MQTDAVNTRELSIVFGSDSSSSPSGPEKWGAAPIQFTSNFTYVVPMHNNSHLMAL